MLAKHFAPLVALAGLTIAGNALADPKPIPDAKPVEKQQQRRQFGDYTVHFSVFNSAFVPPAVASTYNLTRARDRVLVNVSVTRTQNGETSLGLPAEVTGQARNLIQQSRTLDFQTIEEGDATYYLAPLKHTDEEVYHFQLSVQPEGQDRTFEMKFSRTLYVEESDS